MKVKKIPMRKCVVTNERFEKRDLLRVVRTPEGKVIFDPSGKANGRGVYLSKNIDVIKKAKKTRVLTRHLNVDVPDDLFDVLLKEVKDE